MHTNLPSDRESAALQDAKSLSEQYYDYTKTPFPAVINAAALLATPVLSPAVMSPISVLQKSTGSTLSNFWSKPKYLGPTNKAALLFGAAQGLGAYMIQDGDLESGSGFVATWSLLYLFVGGRGSVQALKYGKVWPLVLTALSAGNTLFYGKRFFRSDF